jgi:hypothetical protein
MLPDNRRFWVRDRRFGPAGQEIPAGSVAISSMGYRFENQYTTFAQKPFFVLIPE